MLAGRGGTGEPEELVRLCIELRYEGADTEGVGRVEGGGRVCIEAIWEGPTDLYD